MNSTWLVIPAIPKTIHYSPPPTCERCENYGNIGCTQNEQGYAKTYARICFRYKEGAF